MKIFKNKVRLFFMFFFFFNLRVLLKLLKIEYFKDMYRI